MAWKEEHIHVHVHCDNSQIISLLTEIRDAVKKDDNVVPQEVIDKLDSAIADIKSTIS